MKKYRLDMIMMMMMMREEDEAEEEEEEQDGTATYNKSPQTVTHQAETCHVKIASWAEQAQPTGDEVIPQHP